MGKKADTKQENYLIGLSIYLIQKSLVGCVRLVVLRFQFLFLQAFIGLGMGLLGKAVKSQN